MDHPLVTKCNYFPFLKLKTPLKEIRSENTEAVETTADFESILQTDLQKSFKVLIKLFKYLY